MDVLDPFLTYFRTHPDMSDADQRNECELLAQRQSMIEDYLRGEIPLDDVLDVLQDQGIGADHYLRVVTDNLTHVVDAGIAFTSNDSGILIPSSFYFDHGN